MKSDGRGVEIGAPAEFGPVEFLTSVWFCGAIRNYTEASGKLDTREPRACQRVLNFPIWTKCAIRACALYCMKIVATYLVLLFSSLWLEAADSAATNSLGPRIQFATNIYNYGRQ